MGFYKFDYELLIQKADGKSIRLNRYNKNSLLVSAEIDNDSEVISNTATFQISDAVRKAKDLLKAGDKIDFWAGYNNSMNLIFSGYIEKAADRVPFVLECRDGGYILKNTQVKSIDFDKTSVNEIIKLVVPPAISLNNLNSIDVTLSPFAISETSSLTVLQKIKEEFGLSMYFKDRDTLFINLRYGLEDNLKNVRLHDNLIFEDNTTLVDKNEYKLLIKAVSISQETGKKIEAEFGTEGGDVRTVNFINIQSEADLKTLAQKEHEKYFNIGRTGEIVLYGIPFITHSQAVVYKNEIFLCTGVKYSITANGGFRQTITLGKRIA